MPQKFVGIFLKPLFHVSIDVWKAYDSIERKIFIEVLTGYGLSPKIRRLQQRYWSDQAVVPKLGWYYRQPFNTGIVVTQGGPVSPSVFNILVNVVIRVVMLELFSPQEDQNWLDWEASENDILFYADYGCIVG